ncbi:MAG: DegT/DnrJ/EryC1/StrS family aminotransferase [Candidatus Omnitrophota bacterium]|nr:DegT/DnrJ/EryC1/StrS family aminotransferase [Candidatus Omnitrophota bacterium]
MAKRTREKYASKAIIPIAKPYLDNKDYEAVKEVLCSGWLTQGPKVKQFEGDFASYVGSGYSCAVSSCTAALHLALLAVGVKPGDAVITVSHSFIATANSIKYCGAEPIFIDIDLGTFNMSIDALRGCLYKDCKTHNGQLFYNSRRISAILLVHQMGMPCDLGSILRLARKFNIPIVEDAACAIGSEIKIGLHWEKIGKPHGDIACFSFHPRKVLTTGEGGMIVTNNPGYDRKARLLRNQGMSVSDLIRHKARKIIFEEYAVVGYNYRMTDIQAAIGIGQLKKLPAIIRRRQEIADSYYNKLSGIGWLELPKEPQYCKSNWQSYPLRVKDNAPLSRDEFMQYLLDAGISTRRGIMNAHQELPYKSHCWKLPLSETARDYTLLLPIFNSLSGSQIEYIVAAIKRLRK